MLLVLGLLHDMDTYQGREVQIRGTSALFISLAEAWPPTQGVVLRSETLNFALRSLTPLGNVKMRAQVLTAALIPGIAAQQTLWGQCKCPFFSNFH